MGPRSRRRDRPEWTDWANSLAKEFRHAVDLVAHQHSTRLAATLGGHLAPCQPDGSPWTVEALVDVLETEGGYLPTGASAPLALLKARIRALPDRYRRPDQVAAERRAEVRDQAAALAAHRAERAREHAMRQAELAASDPGRAQVARRVARYAIRPTDTAGTCVGCNTTTDVTPRPYGRAEVPLCPACHPL